jgi:hypothetical protein
MPHDLARLRSDLVTYAGGYLRNPIRQTGLTCAVCTTPLHNAINYCDRCAIDVRAFGADLADLVASLIYAVGGSQAAFVMRAYKAPQPQVGQMRLVSYLIWFGMLHHVGCVEKVAGSPLTHWATVSSHPPKTGEHPLHQIVAAAPPVEHEVMLTAASHTNGDPRTTARGRFISGGLPARSHVLLIDDTWTTGGHGQSAVLALRDSGADRVSMMVAARWLNRGYGNNGQFIKDRLTANYEPAICPWTAGLCP